MQIVVPLSSSAHHVELNVGLEPQARYALMSIVKEIKSNNKINPKLNNADLKANYKGSCSVNIYHYSKSA